MKQSYIPLTFISKSNYSGQIFETIKEGLTNVGIDYVNKYSVDEWVEFFFSPDYMNLNSKKHLDLNLALSKSFIEYVKLLGATAKDMQELRPESEIRDMWLMPVLLDSWAKSKQVYKPDIDFLKALLSTDNVELSRYMISHLPSDTFYVDLKGICENVEGAFVFVKKSADEKIAYLIVSILTEELVAFSCYYAMKFDERGLVKLNLDDLGISNYKIFDPSVKDSSLKIPFSRGEISMLIMQLICYLSIDDPEITESPLTVNTYRPLKEGSKIRNKWSEVHIQDIGIRYGTLFRQRAEELSKATTEHSEHFSGRKSPVPHFRSAHWHKYWVGKGRTDCKVNWIAPVFVSGKEAKDIVIHKV